MLITAVTDLKKFQCFEQMSFVRKRNVSFFHKGPLLETLEFLEISHGSYQHFNFLPYLSLPTQYFILMS